MRPETSYFIYMIRLIFCCVKFVHWCFPDSRHQELWASWMYTQNVLHEMLYTLPCLLWSGRYTVRSGILILMEEIFICFTCKLCMQITTLKIFVLLTSVTWDKVLPCVRCMLNVNLNQGIAHKISCTTQ